MGEVAFTLQGKIMANFGGSKNCPVKMDNNIIFCLIYKIIPEVHIIGSDNWNPQINYHSYISQKMFNCY